MIRLLLLYLFILSNFKFNFVLSKRKSSNRRGNKDKPNIIFILVDDLGYADVGFTHEEGEIELSNDVLFYTPTMDKLALEEGIILNRHYVHTQCSPTRTAFLTGKYPFNVGINGALFPFRDISLSNEKILLPQLLSKYGNYATMMSGKWHLGYDNWDNTPINYFDESIFSTQGAVFYYTHEWCTNTNILPFIPGFSDLPNDTINEFDTVYPQPYGWCTNDLWNGSDSSDSSDIGTIIPPNNIWIEQIFYDSIIDFIERFQDSKNLDSDSNSDSDSDSNGDSDDSSSSSSNSKHRQKEDNEKDAFFVYWATFAPHTPIEEPPNTIDYSECKNIINLGRKKYCKMIQYFDNLLNNLVNYLKNNNLWENTLIILSSDNGGIPSLLPNEGQNDPLFWLFDGFGLNLPLRGVKGGNFEGGIRSTSFITGGYLYNELNNNPLTDLIGTKNNNLISIEDWFITFANLAKIKNINQIINNEEIVNLESFNQWPYITGTASNNYNSNLQIRNEFIDLTNQIIAGLVSQSIIRNDGWKLVVDGQAVFFSTYPDYYNYDSTLALNISEYDEYENEMLFNIFNDPEEKYNLINEYPIIADELRDILNNSLVNYYENILSNEFSLGSLFASAETQTITPWKNNPRYINFTENLQDIIEIAIDNAP